MKAIPKQGDRVRFKHGTEIWEGRVNGEPGKCPGRFTDTTVVYIPVWVDSRPGGREGTTVYVDLRNVVSK